MTPCPEAGIPSGAQTHTLPAQQELLSPSGTLLPEENLSAQEELTFNEGRLISLNEEQLHQLTLSWTNVCSQVCAAFDTFLCSVCVYLLFPVCSLDTQPCIPPKLPLIPQLLPRSCFAKQLIISRLCAWHFCRALTAVFRQK